MRPEFATHLRALLIALGLYAAGALVWFVGPLADHRRRRAAGRRARAGDRDRLCAAAVRAARGVARQRRRRAATGACSTAWCPPRSRAPPQAAAPGAPEVAVIGQRFAQALQVLRSRHVGAKSPFGWLRRRPYVYELPWYIIIGAPGAGKTTTIVNSGLEFPFAAELGPKALRGAGGTRNCDWWFTSDAVLIDTAGRYTTQDSYREADRAAWLGFLQLLVKHRPRQPINGVILTLSATDLLQPDADRKRRAGARDARAHRRVARAARHPLSDLRDGHQVRPAGRLRGVLRRLRQGRARAGVGRHVAARRHRSSSPGGRGRCASQRPTPRRRPMPTPRRGWRA